MMIIHLQHSLVCNDTAHISCITTNYSAYKYNENVHPFWAAAFAASESNFSLSQPVKEVAAARCQPELCLCHALLRGRGCQCCPRQGTMRCPLPQQGWDRGLSGGTHSAQVGQEGEGLRYKQQEEAEKTPRKVNPLCCAEKAADI